MFFRSLNINKLSPEKGNAMNINLSGRVVYFISIMVLCLTINCARQSSPTGGAKDEEPPIAVRSKPVNYSTNFKDKKFIVEFDEYIVLKNVNQELLVSPLLETKPEVKLRGKKMMVKINNTLKDSTTYNFNFFDAITDLNEGNVLSNFQFEFSTGTRFDSIYLGGIVQDAFNYTTEAGIYVMLYDQLDDSTPRVQVPDHIGKTNKDGIFKVPNMKDKPFYVFALKDINNNRKFDLANESIAFSDSTFHPSFKEVELADTFKVISYNSKDKADTVYRDTIIRHKQMVTTIDNVRLFLFTEDFKKQYHRNWYRPERQLIALAFNRKLTDSISIYPVCEKTFRKDWKLFETEQHTDSLIFWITDSALYNNDSLKLQLNYTMKDSNNIDYIKTDTILAVFEDKTKNPINEEPKKKGGLFNNLFKSKNEEVIKDTIKPSELKFTHNINNTFELNKPIQMTARFPIKEFKSQGITFVTIDEGDTLNIPFKLNQDTTKPRTFTIEFKPEEETKYKLLIPAGCFTDIYGNVNDTIKGELTTRKLDYYSNINLSIINVKANSILQLMTEKEVVIDERPISSDTTITYNYLPPQTFIFKLYYDRNENGKWDTGNFKEKKQPEQVFYFDQEVKTKSNWDMNYTWDLYPIGPIKTKVSKKDKTEKNKK
jgi:hypothetical protein